MSKLSASKGQIRQPKQLLLKKPANLNKKKPDVITDYNGKKGDMLIVDLKSFGIDPLTNRKDEARANLGFGNCAPAIAKGAKNAEAFLYQYKSGQLYFNANGDRPGLGADGGLICVFKGAPSLGGVYFDPSGTGTLPELFPL